MLIDSHLVFMQDWQ